MQANNADIIASLILLKREIEAETSHKLKLTILGGTEAHLLATELADANVGVVLMPPRPYVSSRRQINARSLSLNHSLIPGTTSECEICSSANHLLSKLTYVPIACRDLLPRIKAQLLVLSKPV